MIFKAYRMSQISNIKLNNYEKPTYSTKEIGHIYAFAANTNEGISRSYNEDRVSIILNAACPKTHSEEIWPKWHFFGVFDGHGGHGCSEFLRQNLHRYVLTNASFPTNPKQAILNGFKKAEETFLELVRTKSNFENHSIYDSSGSWANVALFVGNMWYIGNVGDSRAILSANKGKNLRVMSIDHKPNNGKETRRIIKSGGSVYQTQSNCKFLFKYYM